MAQYRGGRKEGKKNLEKLPGGGYRNQEGVKFTEEEKRKLESLVNSANRKRNRMLKEEMALPHKVAGKETGKTIGETMGLMGVESDFVLAKKSKSLQRFKSKKEYNKYIKNLEKVVDRNYVDKRTELYKKNYIKGLRNVFGRDAKDLVKQIKNMSPKDFRKMVQQDETMSISYIYDPVARRWKLNTVRTNLGLPEKRRAEDIYEEVLRTGRRK